MIQRSHALRTLSCMLLMLAATIAHPVHAADLEADHTNLVEATLVANVNGVLPGERFTLGVHLKMKPTWHTYWVNPGESGEATKIKLTAPEGVEFGAVHWPLPQAIESFGAITYGYEGEVLLQIPVKIASTFKPGQTLKIDAHVSWLACHDTCIEGDAKLTISMPVMSQDQLDAAASKVHARAVQFERWAELVPVSQHGAIKAITQNKTGKVPATSIIIDWNDAPAKVEWFPIATPAVAIENIVVKHEGKRTLITFKPTVYKPLLVPQGKVEGVIAFVDAKGNRKGVSMEFLVPIED